jgi:hypothetical protein
MVGWYISIVTPCSTSIIYYIYICYISYTRPDALVHRRSYVIALLHVSSSHSRTSCFENMLYMLQYSLSIYTPSPSSLVVQLDLHALVVHEIHAPPNRSDEARPFEVDPAATRERDSCNRQLPRSKSDGVSSRIEKSKLDVGTGDSHVSGHVDLSPMSLRPFPSFFRDLSGQFVFSAFAIHASSELQRRPTHRIPITSAISHMNAKR